ncbi:MAG: CvpA family protein [Candidatus Eremiobacteraeota bacterium]|nr:CvpA family protein [Candidatus Eremiobacteraeota bacterium]
MIAGVAWPDIIIVIVLLIATLKGYSRGFVSELGGAVAVTAALITPWFYNGAFDPQIQHLFNLGPGSAHVVGMFATGLATYIVILLLARLLGTIAKLPLLGLGNALGGAAVGFLKGAILLWLVLFIALFFPLSTDIRQALHESKLAPNFMAYDAPIDDALLSTIPWFARPFVMPYFRRHHL